MADKRKTEESVLVKKAKGKGAAAEKAPPLVEALPGATRPATKSVKIGKLQKKDTPHLPRRLKKAQKKAAAQRAAKT
jgi:hypothetical protein